MQGKSQCERCMGIALQPCNHDAIEVYQTVRLLGPVTFEGIDRALQRFGISGVGILEKIHIIHGEFKAVENFRRQQAANKGAK